MLCENFRLYLQQNDVVQVADGIAEEIFDFDDSKYAKTTLLSRLRSDLFEFGNIHQG